MIGWKQTKEDTFSSSTIKLRNFLPKIVLNNVYYYQFKKQQGQFIEIIPPRMVNPKIMFITKEFVKLQIAGSKENMPGRHHCILALSSSSIQ